MRAYISILLLCLAEYAFSESNNTKLDVLQSLINSNQQYSEKVSADSIIMWGERLESILLDNKQYKELFEIKYLIAQTHAIRGDVSLAIEKAHFMSKEARILNYDLGFALANQTIGDTYVYSNMLHEALPFYQQAWNTLNDAPDKDEFRKRLLVQILQTSLLENNLEETYDYLTQFNNLLPETETDDPLYIYRPTFNACYYLKLGLLEEAKEYLDESNKYIEKNSVFPLPCLTYINALYCEKTGNYPAATLAYDQLSQILFSDFNPIGKNLFVMSYADFLAKTGKSDEACQLYQQISAQQDSLSIKSHMRQVSRLHASYQVSAMELENQAEKNKLIHSAIIVGVCVLLLSLLLASLIKRENKKLAESRLNLEKAKKQTEASIRSKSMFLSNMSHEIRTPLNALSGFSAILAEESIDNETRLQCTEIIQQNSELLLKLINDVIDLSSLEFGKIQFQFKDCNAIVICRNVIEMVQKIKQTKANIEFETSINELTLHTDDARLQQVLINLLINATKFTQSGSITLGLSMQSEDTALFTVTDTGCGIPLEKQKTIFRRFEKLDEHDQGTGLGLFICQLIIKHIGGKIWIDPTYTNGSRFCFTHPIKNRKRS